jgi:uncharacterized protein (DUF885 family)
MLTGNQPDLRTDRRRGTGTWRVLAAALLCLGLAGCHSYRALPDARHDRLTDNSPEARVAWQAREDAWLAELSGRGMPAQVGSRDWVTYGILYEALAGADSPLLRPGVRAGSPEFAAKVQALFVTDLVPAVERFARFLEAECLPRAREDIGLGFNPDGAACYPALVRHFATIEPAACVISPKRNSVPASTCVPFTTACWATAA